MGAVVIKDIEDNKVVAGVPAKVIREFIREVLICQNLNLQY